MKFKINISYFEFVDCKMSLQSETNMFDNEFLNIEKACNFAKVKAWEYFESRDGVTEREWQDIVGLCEGKRYNGKWVKFTKKKGNKSYTLIVSVETM